jgi:DNA-binding MarR family transcriptional regulator
MLQSLLNAMNGTMAPALGDRSPWTLLSNHGCVLLTIAQDPTLRLRDIAREVGITERATIRIVRQLVAEGYLRRHRVGRRNVYAIEESAPLRHPTWRHREVRSLLALARSGVRQPQLGHAATA